jgi:hypothetical protein
MINRSAFCGGQTFHLVAFVAPTRVSNFSLVLEKSMSHRSEPLNNLPHTLYESRTTHLLHDYVYRSLSLSFARRIHGLCMTMMNNGGYRDSREPGTLLILCVTINRCTCNSLINMNVVDGLVCGPGINHVGCRLIAPHGHQ